MSYKEVKLEVHPFPAAVLSVLFVLAGCNGGGGEKDDADYDVEAEGDPGEIEQDVETEPDVPDEPVEDDVPDDQIEEDPVVEEIVEPTWTECDTADWPYGYPLPPDDMECTFIEVPLNHEDPGGETILLNVGRHRSRIFPSGKAIFNFAGGPGGSAVNQSGTIPVYLPHLRNTFDLIYVDQRGTGYSGYMDCPGGYPETRDEWIACADLYSDYDLNHYLTVDAAHDIEFVRRVLGYERIYLRGGSYGTRMALEYMRQYPDSIAAVVLDGLSPPDIDLFGLSIGCLDRGVEMLVRDCEADADCLAVSPTLEADLTSRREDLRAEPRPILVGGSPYVEDEELYLQFLEGFLYTAYFRYRVPRAVHEAVNGDNTRWNRLMSELSGYTITDAPRSGTGDRGPSGKPFRPKLKLHHWLAHEYIAPGILITVTCAEWFPNSGGLEALRTIAAEQTWGSGTYYLDIADACSAWDVDPIDASLRQPVVSDLPTLLLSGEIDLNTWPEWGDHVAETLSGGTHFVVPYATHSTVSVDCAAQIINQFFLYEGRMEDVDSSCLERMRHPGW